MSIRKRLRLAVDIGGTFTDTVLVNRQSHILATTKTPTTPNNPAHGAIDGARRVLAEAGVEWSQIDGFIHGTTLATNALIERRGAVVATVTTKGFRDILEIAYERRYSQYDINLVKPDLIVPRSSAFTIGGRMDARGRELEPLEEVSLARLVEELTASGAEAVAICLMHAYANPDSNSNGAGFGFVRFNIENKEVTFECWPRNEDVSKPDAKQFTGWPITVKL